MATAFPGVDLMTLQHPRNLRPYHFATGFDGRSFTEGYDSRSFRFRVTALGKLFRCICLSHKVTDFCGLSKYTWAYVVAR